MDVVTASFLLLGAVGAGGVILHYAGYIPPSYRSRLERTELVIASLPNAIGLSVEGALNRVAEKAQADANKAAAEWAASQGPIPTTAASEKSAVMSIVRSVGVDRQMQAKVDSLLSEAVLGPALPILRQFAPGLADALEENPQLIDVVLQNPLFKKYVQPRIEQYLGSQKQGHMSVTEGGWGP